MAVNFALFYIGTPAVVGRIATASTRACKTGCLCPKPNFRVWNVRNRFSVFDYWIFI